jgi:hypothetical protein
MDTSLAELLWHEVVEAGEAVVSVLEEFAVGDANSSDVASAWVVFGDVEESIESRDVGASRRKLQSKPFLSQFEQDGCLTSH